MHVPRGLQRHDHLFAEKEIHCRQDQPQIIGLCHVAPLQGRRQVLLQHRPLQRGKDQPRQTHGLDVVLPFGPAHDFAHHQDAGQRLIVGGKFAVTVLPDLPHIKAHFRMTGQIGHGAVPFHARQAGSGGPKAIQLIL